MASFLGGLFESKALVRASISNNAIPRATGSSRVSNLGMGAQALRQMGRWDTDHAITHGMDAVMLVFRCIDVISQNQANLPMKLRKGRDRDKGEWIKDRLIDNLLNFRANSYESATQFRYRLSSNLLLSRRGAFIEIVRDDNGNPAELHLLPAGSTSPIPDARRFVSGYEVHRSDHLIETIDPEDVIWVKTKPHPTDPYQQMTPLTSLATTLETDYLARMFNRTYLANGGRQGLLVSVKGEVSDEDAEELKRRFSGGPMRAGEATVIEADGVSVAPMSGQPQDTQWGSLLDKSKDEILLGFGVPESVMGNAAGRTWDNADAERENFWNDTMVPHCNAVAQSLDPITGDSNDDVVVAYDYAGVDVLQRTLRRDRDEARAEVSAGLRTIDEYRTEFRGQDAWERPGTQVLVTKDRMGIGKTDEVEEAVKKTPIIGGPPEQEGMDGMGGMGGGDPYASLYADPDTAEEDEHKSLASLLESKAIDMRGGVRRPKGRGVQEHPYLDDLLYDEKTLEGILIGWDSQQEEIIADRLHHAKFRQGTRFWEYKDGQEPAEYKALDATYAVDPARWTADLRRSAMRTLENTVTREARRIAGELTGKRGNRGLFELIPAEVDRARLLNESFDNAWNVVEGMANAQLARVMDKINKMADEGASLKEIEKEVRQSIGQHSAWRKRVVQNAVQVAAEGTRFMVASESNMDLRKVWHSLHDDRVRKSHARAHGQVRKLPSRFHIGPAWLLYPRDPAGPPNQTYGCRCYLSYVPA